MIVLVSLFQTPEYGDGILHGGLVYEHGLETSLQRRILFNVLAVLVQRGRAYAVQLASCQHGLEHIARVHASLGCARADYRMELIYEEYDPALGCLDLLEHCLESLLELTSVLGSRHEARHIQSKYLLVLQSLRDIASDYPLRQTLDHRGLADTGLTDEHRVVLGLSRKYLYGISDLAVSPDHGVQLLISRFFYQILSVFVQCVICRLGVVRCHLLVAPDLRERRQKPLSGDAVGAEQFLERSVGLAEHTQEQMLHRDILVAHPLCLVLGAY